MRRKYFTQYGIYGTTVKKFSCFMKGYFEKILFVFWFFLCLFMAYTCLQTIHTHTHTHTQNKKQNVFDCVFQTKPHTYTHGRHVLYRTVDNLDIVLNEYKDMKKLSEKTKRYFYGRTGGIVKTTAQINQTPISMFDFEFY